MALMPSDHHIREVSMFTTSDLAVLGTDDFKKQYDVRIVNAHDISLHSHISGHDWIIISNYTTGGCIIMHRHSGIDSFHRQHGNYESLNHALAYIHHHDRWFSGKRKRHIKAVNDKRLSRSLNLPHEGS